ncbi:MAG: L-threonylcarbamoyladenylate synthase [Pseudomonadota bacterium]
MSQFFQVHPDNPQERLLKQAVEIIHQGGVIVYPTDSAYALGCHTGDKKALQRIRRIRELTERHNFTLMCRDLSELGTYARVGNQVFRILKKMTPGAYTFVLPATAEVPKRLMHPKRKTIGLRVPDHRITQALLGALGEPLLSVTLQLPGDEYPMTDPYDIRQVLEKDVDLVIDGGYCGMEPTSVLQCLDDEVTVLRVGKGDVSDYT